MAVAYTGSLAALYGTSYGIMLGGKAALLCFVLLGGMNFLIVERLRRDPATPSCACDALPKPRSASASRCSSPRRSLTSLPPAVDLAASDRASLSEVIARLTPEWPRLEARTTRIWRSRRCRRGSTPRRRRAPTGRRPSCRAWASSRRAMPRISRGRNTTTIGPASSSSRSACSLSPSAAAGRPGRGTGRCSSSGSAPSSCCARIPRPGRSAMSGSSRACAIPRCCSTGSSSCSSSPSPSSNGASAPGARNRRRRPWFFR